MRIQKFIPVVVMLTIGTLLGWLAASGKFTAVQAQDKKAEPLPAQTGGTPTVLPRPDFHFKGSVGRTYLDSDKAQFPQPVKAPKGARTSC